MDEVRGVTPISQHEDSLEMDEEMTEHKSQEGIDTGLDSKIKQWVYHGTY